MNIKYAVAGLCLSASLVFGPIAGAQTVKPEDRNAALRYATFAYSAPPDLFRLTGDADVGATGFDLATAPESFRAAVEITAANTEFIKQVIEATKLKKCDFEPAWENGIGTLLPHLGKLRSLARLLRFDARRLAMLGDADGAAERLAALVRLSRHATHDHILISSLVGAAIASLACSETQAALDAGKLTPSARATVLAAFESLDTADPFSIKEAMRGERRWTLEWVKNNFTGADAGKKLAATGLLSTMNADPASDESKAIASIQKMSQAELLDAIGKAQPFYDQVLEAWSAPDADEKLGILEEKLKQGEFGPLASIFAPSAAKARSSSRKGEESIAAVKQRLAATK